MFPSVRYEVGDHFADNMPYFPIAYMLLMKIQKIISKMNVSLKNSMSNIVVADPVCFVFITR